MIDIQSATAEIRRGKKKKDRRNHSGRCKTRRKAKENLKSEVIENCQTLQIRKEDAMENTQELIRR